MTDATATWLFWGALIVSVLVVAAGLTKFFYMVSDAAENLDAIARTLKARDEEEEEVTALALAAVFVLERASPSCDGPFSEIASILDYQAPDYYRYVDSYIDNDVLPETSYCYRITGACNLNARGTAHDQVDVWWTREMPETTGVRWNNKTTLTWNPYDRGAHGENPASITYDVIRGVIGDWTTSTTTTQAWSEGTKYVGAVTGAGSWFLVRARNACSAPARGGNE